MTTGDDPNWAHPGVTKQSELFRDDHGHPSDVLEVLVTYCHFATIYQRSPVGLPLPAALKNTPRAEELNRLLQDIARDTATNYAFSGVKAPKADPASNGSSRGRL